MVLKGFMVLQRFTCFYPYNFCDQWGPTLQGFPAYPVECDDHIRRPYGFVDRGTCFPHKCPNGTALIKSPLRVVGM
jgi:hypothetical protein